MTITATLRNTTHGNEIELRTDGNAKELSLPSKIAGQGSAVNGGELLFLAIATCFCNDIYREAARRNILIRSVEVKVWGEFGSEGQPASYIDYSASIDTDASEEMIADLVTQVDHIAEIHNTLRQGISVNFKKS